jgi:two-component system LytT family sensor kinase
MKFLPVTNIKAHVFAWSMFITYEVVFSLPLTNWQFANLWDYFAHYALHISLFYFNAHVALASAINQNKKSYFLYFLLVIAQLLVYLLLKYLILYSFIYFQIPLTPPFKNNSNYISTGIIRAIYFIGFSTAYWFALTTLQNRKRIAEMESSRLKDQISRRVLETAIISTENAYLKSQINPHFLFNTLNFLYNSVSKFSNKIADSFMSLSEIMRYSLTEIGADGKVPLESEIENIENFIKLNQDRFSQKLQVNFDTDGDTNGCRIAPLILMTLIENVFKYGDLFNAASPAKIMLTVDDQLLSFSIENKKKKSTNIESHGIGIQNLKRRLATAHRYSLDVDDDQETYKSILRIWV